MGELRFRLSFAGSASWLVGLVRFAQTAAIRQGAANESDRPFVDICRQRGRGNALTLLPRP